MAHPMLWLHIPEPLVGLCYRRQDPALRSGCSRNMVNHLTRQSRKGRTWVLLCGPCISTFGKLDEQSRDPAEAVQQLPELPAEALMGLAADQPPSCWRCLCLGS